MINVVYIYVCHKRNECLANWTSSDWCLRVYFFDFKPARLTLRFLNLSLASASVCWLLRAPCNAQYQEQWST